MNAVDESIVALALRTAHGLDCVNGSTWALGRIVGRYVGCRLGARMMGMSTTLEYDELATGLADDVKRIFQWACDHPEGASSLIVFTRWAERRHPESLALRVREVLQATRYSPAAVNVAASELEKRMKRGGGA